MTMRPISLAIFLTLTALSLSVSAQKVSLPAFSFTDLEGQPFSSAQLDAEKPVFVMMFDPYCDHCQTQAKHIAEAARQFKAKQVQFVWVTLEPDPEAITKFKNDYFGESGLGSQMYFLMDSEIRFEDFFGYTDDPVNIYCFQPGKKQAKYFGEEQEADVLLNYL